ncbi:hypothetical protein Fot_37193 [Forsythia ovata]|uniref:Uncharacterized protein n=1 Tax=Forsythia ovata TaxID=205694 RepID=A0ABD1SRM8_9LAMI
MNIALDSPLEALAFNYLGYGFLTAVHNIWTWIALVTGAFSFWKIRALSDSEPISRARDGQVPSLGSNVGEWVEGPAAEPVELPAISIGEETKFNECGTKGKFSLYYNEGDYREGGEDGESEDNGGGRVASEKLERWCNHWERVRMGDMGWYKYQDLTVLDGSVVRLWDGYLRGREATRHIVSCW